jgi:hypothetical protein
MDKTVDETTAMLQAKLGDQPIAGIYFPLALRILEENGYSYKEAKAIKYGRVFFIVIPMHVVVCSNSYVYDNGPYKGKTFEDLRKVWHCFEITKEEKK